LTLKVRYAVYFAPYGKWEEWAEERKREQARRAQI
jgi:hypothetical protein